MIGCLKIRRSYLFFDYVDEGDCSNMKSTVLITGGLGNQLFQYTFMVYLKKKLGADVSYNCSSINFHKQHSGFQADEIFDFSQFSLDKRNFYNFYHRAIRKLKRKMNIKKNFIVCNDKKFSEDKIYSVYEGFWQKAYFYDYVKEELKASLKDLGIHCKNMEFAENMRSCESVFLHIRRGDYCKDPSYVDLSKTNYYKEAISYYRNLYEVPKFFVFSDDIAWCRDYFSEDKDFVFVEYEEQNALSDMYLMHQCKNAIIANSSFSWWGTAFDTKKVVIHPTKYNIKINTDGLYPEEWIAIDF